VIQLLVESNKYNINVPHYVMDLSEIIALGLKEDDVIEVCLHLSDAPLCETGQPVPVFLAYFRELVLDPVGVAPKKAPYIEISREKEKHGVAVNYQYWKPDEIKWICRQGRSAVGEKHYHS
jgi:hypothetical protein